jgi:UDP-N-acetylmuramyl tripeptide synthase
MNIYNNTTVDYVQVLNNIISFENISFSNQFTTQLNSTSTRSITMRYDLDHPLQTISYNPGNVHCASTASAIVLHYLDDYRNAKELLFYKTTDANIINIDDEGGKVIANNIKDLKTPLYTYGIDNKADFMAKNIKIKAAGGISSLNDAEDFIRLGASRLGTSRIIKIVKENKDENVSDTSY